MRFTAGGKDYDLSLGMRALKAYQRSEGETAVAAFQAIEESPGDMVRVSALFRAACTPSLTEEEADAVIDEIGIGEAARLLGEAAKAAFPENGVPNSDAQPDQA